MNTLRQDFSKRLRLAVAAFSALLFAALPAAAQSEQPDAAQTSRQSETQILEPSATPASEAQTGLYDSIAARLERLLSDDIFRRTQVGLLVVDAADGTTVFESGADQQLRPASNEKIVTALAALFTLGTNYQYATRVYTTGVLTEDSVLHGTIILRGGMDPLVTDDDLAALARAVREAGIYSVDGDVRFDNSFKDDARLGWGWCWDDNETPLTPLLYGAKPGLERQFLRALAEAGITYVGGGALTEASVQYVTTPSGAELRAERRHHIDQALLPMMKKSDNLFAESLFYQLAAHSGTVRAGRRQATAAIERVLADAGVEKGTFQIADGSGLSLYNYLTPRLLVRLLRYAYQRSDVYAHFLPALPIAGIDGTLSKRMRSGSALGNVRAKTGTVEGISTLSGYCTAANGRTLVFSIMNAGIRHTSTGRNFQDRVCQALTRPLFTSDAADVSASPASEADAPSSASMASSAKANSATKKANSATKKANSATKKVKKAAKKSRKSGKRR